MLDKFKTVLNLYSEEVHFVALKTSKRLVGGSYFTKGTPMVLNTIEDLKDLNVGGGGRRGHFRAGHQAGNGYSLPLHRIQDGRRGHGRAEQRGDRRRRLRGWRPRWPIWKTWARNTRF